MTEIVEIPIQMIPSDENIYLPQESELEVSDIHQEKEEIVGETERVAEEVSDVLDGLRNSVVLENGEILEPAEMEKDVVVEEEIGLKEDDEEEDAVINFNVATPPLTVAKPIDIIPTPPCLTALGSPTGVGRLRNMSMNNHLTLNLQPQILISSKDNLRPTVTTISPGPTLTPPSLPALGRFTVTTCPDSPSPKPPTPETPPPPKDELSLTPLERLTLYAENVSMPARNGVAVQYVNFVKDAPDPEVFVGASQKVVEKLLGDPDLPVRLAFLEQLPNIVRVYKPAFKKLRMMGFLGESIKDENYNVRRLAQVAIGQLVEFAPELMTRETIQASVVPLLIQIFYAESTADLVIDALNLFCKLLDRVGPEPVKRLFVPEFNKLCGSDVAQIRQVCAQNLAYVVRYFTVTQVDEFKESDDYCRVIQERIASLAQDFAWHVRETVAGTFPQLVDLCHRRWPTFANQSLYPLYIVLLADQAKQVRRCACRGLGRIIATSADTSKTRLQITSSGTVEFIPPSTFPGRYSESDNDPDYRRISQSESGLDLLPNRRPNIRTTLMNRTPTSTISSPALQHSQNPQVRRSYYHRLGIPPSGNLSYAMNEADDFRRKSDGNPDFNSFHFWRNPMPLVAVSDDKTPILISSSGEVAQEDASGLEEPVENPSEVAEDLSRSPDSPEDHDTQSRSSPQDEHLELMKRSPRDEHVEGDEEEGAKRSDRVAEYPSQSGDSPNDDSWPAEKVPQDEREKNVEEGSSSRAGREETEAVEESSRSDGSTVSTLERTPRDEHEEVASETAENLDEPGTSEQASEPAEDDKTEETHDNITDDDLVDARPPEEPAVQKPTYESEHAQSLEKHLHAIDADDVSSTSSDSQDLTVHLNQNHRQILHLPLAYSFDIDPNIIEKHRRRDRAVLQQLKDSGEIATRLEDILPNIQFLREFLSLSKDPDRDTVTQVAVDFPAVALTIGRQHWHELQECHKLLASHNNCIASRELMAASLPRIAEIVGYYHTVTDLVPLLDTFLKDTDSVRLAMVENYTAFIARLPPEVRPMHLLRLCEFFSPDEERNWRYRYACAEQIAHLALMFPPKLVVRSLMDAAWFFAKDKTAEVRKNSCLALSSIFLKIEQQRDTDSRRIFLEKLRLFLKQEDFRVRQVFAQICEDLLAKAALSYESFSQYFGERFWPLFDDNVVAVRLAAARCLLHFPPLGRKQSDFARAVDKLQRDGSRSVQEIYHSIVCPPVATPPGREATPG